MANDEMRAPAGGFRDVLNQRWTLPVVLFTVVLGVVGFLVFYPLLVLLIKSFETSQLGATSASLGFANWQAVFSDSRMTDAITNTITLSLTRQVIALVIGVSLAWVISRTDVPWPNRLMFGFWISLFLPSLSVLLGWIVLFDGPTGLVNEALVNWIPFIDTPPIHLFSWWGIVFAHLMTGTLAIQVMLLVPAFRNLDGSLEEASMTLGATRLGTFLRVVVPGILPAIILVTILGLIRSLDAFELELVLGGRDNLNIYSTMIFREVTGTGELGNGTALAMLFLSILVPLIVLQRWLAGRSATSIIRGKQTPHIQALGRWKWPAFGVIAALVLSLTVIPVLLALLGTFTAAYGSVFADNAWTLENWSGVGSDSGTLNSLSTSILLGLGSSALAVSMVTAVVYITVRTQFWGKQALGVIAWLPSTLPGIMMSLGFLWLFLQTGLLSSFPEQNMSAMVIVVALGGLTLGVQIVKSSMVQLGPELEEASWAAGASPVYTFRNIVLPLIAPAVLVVSVLTFATAVRATSIVALLATGDSKPLSLLQLDHMTNGEFGGAAVIGVFLVILITGAALIGRMFGLKVGLGEGR